ncbi:hypothetical protein Srufu_075050 [Streptomyces libani subsp. rufus]|nr:hypothetical protein Srufu_075050 [Streptomyces libani subsp. rufus]
MSHGDVRRLYRLKDGVHSVRTASGEVALAAWPHLQEMGRLTAEQRSLLQVLSTDWSAEELTERCPHDQAETLLAMLSSGGWLITTVVCGDRPLFSSRPLVPHRKPLPPAEPRRLSRFVSVRRDGDEFVVESPAAGAEVRLYDSRLAEPVLTACAAHRELPDVPPEAVRLLAGELADAGVLATAAEAHSLSRAQWSPHELAFHHGSRLRGDHRMGQDFGGSYWAKGRFDAPPGKHPRWMEAAIELPRPDLDRLRVQDPALAEVMEARQSLRSYDEDTPLTVEELGEFLFRTARVRATGSDSEGLDISSRPYPAGGAAYELEVYPLVRNVRGLDAGLYHYAPHGHRLHPIPASATALRWLMKASAAGMTGEATPQVLLVIATRFGRLAWKYQAMGYALTLKHVGVLYQSMYLAATAMGLAPCALGVGDSDAFAEATGLDYFEETSVGEFALGSLPVARREGTG